MFKLIENKPLILTNLIKIIHMQNLSEQEQFRRQSLQSIRDLGIDPYPAALFPVNAYAKDIKND